MPVPGHAPAAPDLDPDAWPCWSLWPLLGIAGLRPTLLPPNLTLPGLASALMDAPATRMLGWSPLPFPGQPCVSLRYGGMGSWLVRRCPPVPHGTVLSAQPLPLHGGCSRGGCLRPAQPWEEGGHGHGTAAAACTEDGQVAQHVVWALGEAPSTVASTAAELGLVWFVGIVPGHQECMFAQMCAWLSVRAMPSRC